MSRCIPELFQKAGFARRVVRAMSLQIVSDFARIPMSGETSFLKQEEYKTRIYTLPCLKWYK